MTGTSKVLASVQPIIEAMEAEDFPLAGASYLDLAEQFKPLFAFDYSSLNAGKGATATRRKVMSMRDEAFYILTTVAAHEVAAEARAA